MIEKLQNAGRNQKALYRVNGQVYDKKGLIQTIIEELSLKDDEFVFSEPNRFVLNSMGLAKVVEHVTDMPNDMPIVDTS